MPGTTASNSIIKKYIIRKHKLRVLGGATPHSGLGPLDEILQPVLCAVRNWPPGRLLLYKPAYHQVQVELAHLQGKPLLYQLGILLQMLGSSVNLLCNTLHRI
jgi:hypothetical protein